VVDDEEFLRFLVREWLEQAGYTVERRPTPGRLGKLDGRLGRSTSS
jgi:CheY-like chemotaxis protein